MLRSRIARAAALAAVLFAPLAAPARPNIRNAFFQVYPAAVGTRLDTLPSQPGHCGVCHYDFLGGGPRNPYGAQVESALPNFPSTTAGRRQAIQSIENLDPDGDGFSTLQEVTASVLYYNTPTFPGLTPANIGQIVSVDPNDILGHLVPSTGADTTPPEVTVLTPNGGETLVGNQPVTITWSATDAGGIAIINMFLSTDGGTTFPQVGAAVPNTGSYIWFPPNRPTTQGIFRIVAIDNSFNSNEDVSDAVFSVARPAGGIVPTTLRDFDLPGTQPFGGGSINDPMSCATCHGNYAPTYEPYRNWQGSMMSQAARDPLFEACMAIANQDAPDSGDLCLRCHIPKGWIAGRSTPTDGTQMLVSDKSGVSCDVCHRLVDPIYDPDKNPVEDQAILAALTNPPTTFGNGMYVLDPTGARRGPFVDATAGHPILVSPFHREGALCGTCHDVSNPAFEKDGFGNYVPNTFDTAPTNAAATQLMPIERTYSEWLHSDYNTPQGIYAPQFGGNKDFVASCQDCHLRDVTGVGCNVAGAPTRTDLPLHDLTGGSTWLPTVLPVLYPDLPAEVNPAALADAADRARYMLQNAATLEAQQAGALLHVSVTNETGHKLPTGYPEGRRMWLNVRFYDASEQLVGESAAYDLATGVLSHDAEAKIYECEPGLDEVTAPLVGVDPGPSFHFVLNNRIWKDNRIPPRGFTNAAFETFGGAPVGASYADGQYWDDTQYALPPTAASAVVTLYYQSTSKEYVEFLRDENTTNNAGAIMYDLWANYGMCPPEPMASVTVPVAPPTPGDLNGDGSIDAADAALLSECLAGPGNPDPGCGTFDASDLDGDYDVDLADVALLQALAM